MPQKTLKLVLPQYMLIPLRIIVQAEYQASDEVQKAALNVINLQINRLLSGDGTGKSPGSTLVEFHWSPQTFAMVIDCFGETVLECNDPYCILLRDNLKKALAESQKTPLEDLPPATEGLMGGQPPAETKAD